MMEDRSSQYFLGTALIQLQHLFYDQEMTGTDDCTSCCHRGADHILPALITPSLYEDALQKHNLHREELYQIGSHHRIHLPQNSSIFCVHGRSSLESARYDISRLEEWWKIDLFTCDIPRSLVPNIQKRHKNGSDGEKYLWIRFHQRHGNQLEQSRWTRELGPKRRNLSQILRLDWLCCALGNLEHFRSLWVGFQFTSLSLILSWRCYEEIENYLGQIQKVWRDVVGENGFYCDEQTIYHLQGLTPRWSHYDRTKILSLFENGQVFGRVKDPIKRHELCQNVLGLSGQILSFSTFYDHAKFIGPAMLSIRELFVPEKIRPTVLRMLRENYSTERPSSFPIQHGDFETQWMDVDKSLHFKYAYWQLCFFAIRKLGRFKQQEKLLNHPGWLIEFGHLAHDVGFRSDRIQGLKLLDADYASVKNHLEEERPKALWQVSDFDFHKETESRCKGLAIFRSCPPSTMASISADTDGNEQQPFSHSLFLPVILHALKQEARAHVTGFGKLVIALLSFLGNLDRSLELNPEPAANQHIPPKPSTICLEPENIPDAYDEDSINVASSSVYSPTPADVPTRTHGTLTFWELPTSEKNTPFRRFFFPRPTADLISSTVREIRHKDRVANFLVLKQGTFRAIIHTAIGSYIKWAQKRRQNPEIFYYYKKSPIAWTGKAFNSNIWVAQSTPWG